MANQSTDQLATEDNPERSVGHLVEDTFAANDASSAGSASRIYPGDKLTDQNAEESDVPGTDPDEDIPDEETPSEPSPGDVPPDREAPQGRAIA
ncbi:MAG: hypothetical protein PCALPYG88_2059 [uncultured Paraburkholderia sp.]|uniref:hypothetical protein n=1 Tax=uncultured Paraburkholderia sp. TaxID=1822466 RepID=UPI0025953626|nr:hypothetical protein [uncultured Paraburkholderia sp.]CAH2897737.1 MAG: hypothetical protein PCALPYG08_3036 [uncultured Paraburkholderia sp.]CAH2918647.1 MAG: hypothetical protein PCALPYG88_2059 [uncultured Paraburkholderia sp.]